MLFSYKKPGKESSSVAAFSPKQLVDEEVKYFWFAECNRAENWVEIDLKKPGKAHAIQLNYHDHESETWDSIRTA